VDGLGRLRLAAGESKQIPLNVTPKHRGVFHVRYSHGSRRAAALRTPNQFRRHRPDTRKALTDSPFGIWCFWGGHSISPDPLLGEKLASIMIRAAGVGLTEGSRIDSSPRPPNVFQYLKDKYKITLNVQFSPYSKGAKIPDVDVRGAYYDPELFAKEVIPWLEQAAKKGYEPSYMVLHESRINPALLRRFSEYFGGAPYDMPADEKAKYDIQFKNAVAFAEALKKAAPDAKIVAFNDYPSFIEEHFKRGFPAEVFDVIGIEQANFHRQPECQPSWYCMLRMRTQRSIRLPNLPELTVYSFRRSRGKFSLHRACMATNMQYQLGWHSGCR